MPRILTRNLSQWTLIQENKKTAQALQASEQNFRNSLDNSLMGIRIIDADWHTLYVNRVFLDIFGYKNSNEVTRTSLQDRYTPEENNRYLLRMEKSSVVNQFRQPEVDIIGKTVPFVTSGLFQ